MKKKWNWIDTVIVIVLVVLIAGACYFLFGRNEQVSIQREETSVYITLDTSKDRIGTYDSISAGQEIRFAENEQLLGTVESAEILPYRSAVFDESTKSYVINSNEKYPFCRVVVKTSGYINENNEIIVCNKAVKYDDELNLETTLQRFTGTVVEMKAGDDK